ncbi:MAG: type II toxin-antitoxin system VapC family toxin [Dehalococcoidia bacterium]
MIAIVDAGPLYAAADANDEDHERSAAVFRRPDLELVIPAFVAAEVTYIIGRRLGAEVESRFLAGLSEFVVEAPYTEEWQRIGELVRQYGDFPLGGPDASVIVLAERLNTDLIVTLDHRHFRAVRPRHCDAFRLLPD